LQTDSAVRQITVVSSLIIIAGRREKPGKPAASDSGTTAAVKRPNSSDNDGDINDGQPGCKKVAKSKQILAQIIIIGPFEIACIMRFMTNQMCKSCAFILFVFDTETLCNI